MMHTLPIVHMLHHINIEFIQHQHDAAIVDEHPMELITNIGRM